MKKHILLGYSGHAYVVADIILANKDVISGYYGTEKEFNPYQINYLGNEKTIHPFIEDKNHYYFPSVGANNVRKKLVDFIEANNLMQTNIIHPTAQIAQLTTIEKSVFIGANVIINPLSHIKKGCIINTRVIIEHECMIGEFSHIAPGTVLTGNVEVGNSVFIGANSVIIPGKKIGDNAIIGAGSVVLHDIPADETWAGIPARKIS